MFDFEIQELVNFRIPITDFREYKQANIHFMCLDAQIIQFNYKNNEVQKIHQYNYISRVVHAYIV